MHWKIAKFICQMPGNIPYPRCDPGKAVFRQRNSFGQNITLYLLFGLQVHSEAFFLQPLQTPFSIGIPHFLQGEQPHD